MLVQTNIYGKRKYILKIENSKKSKYQIPKEMEYKSIISQVTKMMTLEISTSFQIENFKKYNNS